MKIIKLALALTIISPFALAQTNEIVFNLQQKDFSAAPRTTTSPMSIRLWDSYNSGGPTQYGTVFEIYGRSGHQTTQLNFGHNGKIQFREAFYGETEWSEWVTLLDSRSPISFPLAQMDFSSAPRTNIGPMSIRLWDSYNSGGPTTYGTVLEIYGRNNHQTTQLNFGHDGKLQFREAFYGDTEWSPWTKLLDSNSNVSSSGNLLIDGSGPHYVANGNVGIGTIDPGTHKLAVNGTVRAKEVIVETGWSDFVFEDSYRLRTLTEVESHIEEHGHLPDVPSAAVVESEGLSVGEAQKIMMQKIEELTLYMIDLKKENEELKTRVAELESN